MIHLIVGNTGSGKTTYETGLNLKTNGIVFSIDTWNNTLFLPDKKPTDGLEWFLERIERAEKMMMDLVHQLENAKTDSILDLGLSKFSHREKFRKFAEVNGYELQTSTHRKGSDHLISLGFQYLYRDLKTAMYRFNQAYLLDSTNTDIYWGFGAVYMTLGQYQKAKEQYVEGLKIDPDNTHLLTDYGTYFMANYYALEPADKKNALQNLDTAIKYMTRSYILDPTDQNTTFKLSTLYWNKGDCNNAWKYYKECKVLGGQPITEAYTKDLEKKCQLK